MATGFVEAGPGAVRIDWKINLFRADRFEEEWAPVAEAVLKYGAKGYIFMRNADDIQQFTQYSFFEKKADWEGYWYSDEVSAARAELSGVYQVPVVYLWEDVVAAGSFSAVPPAT